MGPATQAVRASRLGVHVAAGLLAAVKPPGSVVPLRAAKSPRRQWRRRDNLLYRPRLAAGQKKQKSMQAWGLPKAFLAQRLPDPRVALVQELIEQRLEAEARKMTLKGLDRVSAVADQLDAEHCGVDLDHYLFMKEVWEKLAGL